MRRFCLPIFALLAACGEPEKAEPEPVPREDVVGEARPGELRRAWRPENDQAKSMAGALTLTAGDGEAEQIELTLAFAEGITIRGQALDPGDARREFGPRFGSLTSDLGSRATLVPWVYRVEAETVAMSAPHGGLCGGQRTTFLVIAEFVDESDNAWKLRIVAFHRPPESSDPPFDCFTYDYILPL